MNIENTVAIVTGGSRGIGFAIAHELLKTGAKYVAIFDLIATEGEVAVKKLENEFEKGKVGYYHCDVTNTDQLKGNFAEVVDTFKVVDILVNNAGVGDESHPERMIDINIRAVIMGNLIAIDHMGKHNGGKGGAVVNVASYFGLIPSPLVPIYGATKHAIISYTRSMKDHNNALGIRIMAVCPGWTNTNILTNIDKLIVRKFVLREKIDAVTSNRKIQEPTSVGIAVRKMIQEGENGAIWLSKDDCPPIAVDEACLVPNIVGK